MISKAKNRKPGLHFSVDSIPCAHSETCSGEQVSEEDRGQAVVPPLLVLMQLTPRMAPWAWGKARAPSTGGSAVNLQLPLSHALQRSESSLMASRCRSDWFLFLPSSGVGPWSRVSRQSSEMRLIQQTGHTDNRKGHGSKVGVRLHAGGPGSASALSLNCCSSQVAIPVRQLCGMAYPWRTAGQCVPAQLGRTQQGLASHSATSAEPINSCHYHLPLQD